MPEPVLGKGSATVIPDHVWFAYGVGLTVLIAFGSFSFTRPAADIFAVGVTQVKGGSSSRGFTLLVNVCRGVTHRVKGGERRKEQR